MVVGDIHFILTDLLRRVFYCLKTMDEYELNQLLRAIDALDDRLDSDPEYEGVPSSYGQLRDDLGYRVEGCYRTNPAPTE